MKKLREFYQSLINSMQYGKKALCFVLAMTIITSMVMPMSPNALAAEQNLGSSLGIGAKNNRFQINFNNDWHYQKGDVVDAEKEKFVDSGWSYVNLPHSTTLYTPDNKEAYLGISWYRKTFTVDSDLQGKKLLLTFEAAMQSADVWINGVKITHHDGGYSPFVMDISDKISYGVSNVIAVKVDSRYNANFAPGKNKPDFQYFGGIYGNSYITVTDKLHITDIIEANAEAGGGVFIAAPEVCKDSAIVTVKTNVKNEGSSAENVTIQTELLDEDGIVVQTETSAPQNIAIGADNSFMQTMKVLNPHLWSVNTPELYTVRTIVKTGNLQRDTVDTSYGIRKVEWKRDGIYINDEKIESQGTNLHSETYMLGNAIPDSAIFAEIKSVKENGFDAVRMSHYPHRAAYYEACDKYGVMVIDCMPGWQQFYKTTTFLNGTYNDLRTMIRTQRNHPCIVAWEASLNESSYTKDWATEVNKIAHVEYPTDGVSKAYTAGCSYWSCYDIGLGTPQADIFGTKAQGAEASANSNKPIIIAEYGDWSYGGSSSTSRVTREPVNSYSKKGGDTGMLIQADNIQESVAVNRTKGANWLGIDAYWDYADYAGFDAGMLTYCGVVDLYRLPKFAAYFYRSQRPANVDLSKYGIESGPMVYIANTWAADSPTDVRIYSNCDEVELFLNGKSLGTQGHDKTVWGPHGDGNQKSHPTAGAGKEIDASSLTNAPITFKLGKFESGELKAVGKINGVEKTTYLVNTPEEATQINLRPENDVALKLDGSDARLVWIDILDKNGTVVNTASTDVTLKVTGPGMVVGEKTVTTRGGQLAVWVRSKRGSGDITLKATAKGVTAKAITLPTQAVSGLPAVPKGGDADETIPVQLDNIFLNATTTASTENKKSKELAQNAIDGNSTTKWCAANGSYPQWLQVDLKNSYQISDLQLAFETDADGVYQYTISVSDSPNNWTDKDIVIDKRNNTSDIERTLNINKAGRYVRIALTGAPNKEWAVLREISGYGSVENSNILLNKVATASTENKKSKEFAQNAIDGNSTTKWCAANGSYPQWLQVDLKNSYLISDLQLAFETDADGVYQYTISVSDSPNNWTDKDIVIDKRNNTSDKERTLNINKVGRYVRIALTGAPNKEWAVLREISGHGFIKNSNIALNKTATASSENSGSTAKYASDGDLNTLWRAKAGAEASGDWWQVDLGSTYQLSDVQLEFEQNDAAYKFVLQGSTDGEHFKTIKDFSQGDGCGQTVKISSDAVVQYLKIFNIVTNDMTNKLPTIKEVSAYGKEIKFNLQSVSREKKTDASSCADGIKSEYGSNGVPNWYWYPATLGNEWWCVDTNGYYDLDNIQMTWNDGDVHKYSIQTSTDGSHWTTVVDKSQNTEAEIRPYNDVTGLARFVRVSLPAGRTKPQGFGLLDAYAPTPIAKAVMQVMTPEGITISKGTPFNELALPSEVRVQLEGNISATLPVVWSDEGYQANSMNAQKLSGKIQQLTGVDLKGYSSVSIAISSPQNINKNDLAKKIILVESYAKSDYTEATWLAFETALKKAKEVNSDALATQEQITSALNHLTAAVAALAPIVSIDSIAIDKTATVTVGKTTVLAAIIHPANATNIKLIWTSSNEGVATVDNNGKVTAIAAGTANITVKTEDGNQTATCSVTIVKDNSSNSSNKKDKDKSKTKELTSETKVTENGNTASVTPSAKLTTLESGKAIVKTEISEAAVLNSPAVQNATVQNPAKISIVVPVSDTVAQLQSANVTKVQINVAIPSSVISNDKISIDDIKLDNAVFTAAKAANKDVIVSVQKENNAELYAVIISGKVLKAKANTEVAPNFAANVNALVQGSTTIRFKHNSIFPSGAATLRVAGFKSNAVYHVFYQNPKTGYAEPIMANNTYKADINGNVVFPIASLSNYEICTSKPSNAYPVISDTTDTVNVAKDGTYTYKMTVSKNVVPKFTLGNGKAFQTRVVKKGNDYYLSIKALSHPGDSTGVYCMISGTNVVALGSAKIK